MAGLSGYESRLMTGVGQLLAAQGLAKFTLTGAYGAEDWGVFLALTPDKPDRAITLMTYPVESTDLTSGITGLQFKLRGRRDPREVEDVASSIYDLLHMKEHYLLGDVPVNLSWHQSGAWLGQDGNLRIERSENYYLRTEREATHLIL